MDDVLADLGLEAGEARPAVRGAVRVNARSVETYKIRRRAWRAANVGRRWPRGADLEADLSLPSAASALGPASSLALCGEAWKKLDPNETLRILFTWGFSESEAARFLALVEPSLGGLERIVRVCEPAHGFVYAKHSAEYGGSARHPY